ncbi:MAG: S26 family signal peptidase [Planctomycetota bacterium]
MSTNLERSGHHESPVVETMQQLIIAFVLAMTFRGFVAEGFVIPTGSMAPTLMGRHLAMTSSTTGYDFAVGFEQSGGQGASQKRGLSQNELRKLVDPNLEGVYPFKLVNTNRLMYPGSATDPAMKGLTPRLGDRIFVLKTLYPFRQPDRFDVVVFKNPTDPIGDAQNYIKRLIGLPNETIWIADGDVFSSTSEGTPFQVRRKSEHVQRAVWQPVHRSDATVVGKSNFTKTYVSANRPFPSSPWRGDAWKLNDRVYACDSDEPTALQWDSNRFPITDWNHYNLLTANTQMQAWPVSDVRVAGSIVREKANLTTTLELRARSHVFEFNVTETQATIHMRLVDSDTPDGQKTVTADIELPPAGDVFNVEFWHADQRAAIYIDGRLAVEILYDWNPEQRMRFATGLLNTGVSIRAIYDRLQPFSPTTTRRNTTPAPIQSPELTWRFAGTPLTMQRVDVDRDLAYQYMPVIPVARRHPENGPTRMPTYGTHPDHLATLGPDHYMMAGDNSPASLDSRWWGEPHPIVEAQVDTAAFLVHRKLLLGKAWTVYFPSPQPRQPGGAKFVPDFGSLRFIR